MMLNYLQAENLKCRRIFIKKLIFLAPMVTVLLAFLSGKWFQWNAFNWCYVMILPGYVSLMAARTNDQEEKKLRYRAIFALPISLKKVWVSKVLVNAIYMSLSCMILLVGIVLGGYKYPNTIPVFRSFAGAVLIAVTFLWQIPLCLFLAKKFGLIGAVLINVCGGTILNFLTVSTSKWWLCPYSWTTRIMCPVLGVLPNGCLAESGDPLLNPEVVPIGIILSVVLFVLLLIVTANWFSKQEVN
ncbi:lantibiotic immunity ABC transporter MutE/EpiE family permease subunit [Clostridium gasigenes]|uniref:lantibiotic immunity ABC transporter MutE/EpiE family permease subunit n=1 Tax=Clostridium gasigenes TaxID=94869 RepID=UPI003399ACF9